MARGKVRKIRAGERTPALESLRRAHEAAPEVPRYSLVYAVALHDSGKLDRALAVLRKALE